MGTGWRFEAAVGMDVDLGGGVERRDGGVSDDDA